MFFIPFQAVTSRWFDRKRCAALSILGTGFSLRGFIVLPLVALVIEAADWRVGFVFSGALTAVVVLPIAIVILRNRPEDVGATVDGMPQETREPSQRSGVGMTLGQAIRTPMLWVLALALMLFFYGLIGWTVHLIPFFESRGLSRETAALLASVSSGAGIVARLALGMFIDRYQRFEVPAAVLIGLVVCAMSSLLIDSGWVGILGFLMLWVIGTSAGAMAEALTLTRASGLAQFPTILGAVVVIETAGEILSPSLVGDI